MLAIILYCVVFLVSFDVVALSDECPVIFAIDSEGELYSTTINVNGLSPPLTRPLISPSSLPCDPVDLRIVDHPMNALFSVFAVLSLSNVVCFLVAVPDDHSTYNLFVQEHLQLAQSSFWSLCASDFESTILIASGSAVFHLDVSPWLQEYSSILSGSSSVTSHSSGKNSSVRELLVTADYGKAYTCSPCTSRERAVGMICTSTNPRESTTMFVACTQNPPLATAFLRKKLPESHDLDSAFAPAESLSQLNEKALNAILSKRENLAPIRKGATHQQVIKNLADFFDAAKRNQIVLSAALEMSKDRLSVLVKLATQLAERQNTVNQRLLQVFRQNVVIKDRNEQLRLDVSKTLSRVDKVSACLADDRKLSADEVKLFGRLKEYRAKMLTNSLKISRLSIEAAQLQREARGPARPFTASASANLFVLQYTDEELTALRDRLEQLSAKFDGFRSRNITDNKENLGISN